MLIAVAPYAFGGAPEFTPLPFPKRAKGQDIPAKLEMKHSLSLDFEKSGHKFDYLLYWDGKNTDPYNPRGHLHFRSSFGGTTADDFDLDGFPHAATSFLELPGRNVLVVKQTGLGAPAGDEYHVFSSANGHIYRVQFLENGKSEPIIFGEHYSAGAPSAISFLKGGEIIKTLSAWPLADKKTRVKEYHWDGANYEMKKELECSHDDCPDIRKEPVQ